MHHSSALYNEQRELEQESIGLGAERYRKQLDEQGDDALSPGMQLIKAAVGPMAAKIKELQEEAWAGKPGRHVGVLKFLTQMPAEHIAFTVARRAIHSISQRLMVQRVSLSLANDLEETINHLNLETAAPKLYKQLQKKIAASNDADYRHIVMMRQLEFAKVDRVKWGLPEKTRMGATLLHWFAEVTGLIEMVKMIEGKNDSPIYVTGTADTLEWLQNAHCACELLNPVRMPMIVPPKPWSGPYGGGYLTSRLRVPLVKWAPKTYLEELRHVDMPMVYEAINAIQETPWRVNKTILRVALEVWEGGGRLGKMPPRDPLPLPPKGHDPETDTEAHTAWKRDAARVYQANVSLMSKRVAVAGKLSMGQKFAKYERLYFPHALDWRGRIYPSCSVLTPQGDDISKALLEFANGKPLGEHGATWLAVHIANCFGVDKVAFEDRIAWVEANEDAILDSAMNPLDGGRFWTTADSPFCALAACIEWAGYRIQGESYVSHIPVSWDGSCNGLQNFSAMLRDPVGGAAVNLIPADKPSDIYGEVARVASEMIEVDAAEGNEVAERWLGKITRKLTKRNTMTLPYGVSRFGMTDQLIMEFKGLQADGDPLAPSQETMMTDARYLAGKNWDAIGQVVVAARRAMDWLMEAAKVAASDGLPIHWTTPAGMPVLQSYREMQGTELDFQVAGHRYRMLLQVEGSNLNARKQASGISPNFVHSLDAAHLMRTIQYCREAGLADFAMIHDSYGAHACDAPELSYQLRRAFVDQYKGDVLGDFKRQLEDQLPPDLAAKLPPLPPMGTLDLDLVMQSDYFFA